MNGRRHRQDDKNDDGDISSDDRQGQVNLTNLSSPFPKINFSQQINQIYSEKSKSLFQFKLNLTVLFRSLRHGNTRSVSVSSRNS